MKIINKLVILIVILLVFINVVTYLIDIPFMNGFIGIMNDMEFYFICFLVVLSVASSALIDDRAIIASNLFVASSIFFLIVAIFNFATGNSVIPSSSSLRIVLEPFVSFNTKYNDTLGFLFSVSFIGLVFTGLFSIIEQPDIKNSVSKKIKFISKAALFINIVVFLIGIIITPLNFDIGLLIFNKVFYILSEIIIYSAILINIANFGFDVETVPESEFVHTNFVLPAGGYNINQNRSSSFNGSPASFARSNSQPVTRIVSNAVVQSEPQAKGVELFGSSLSTVDANKPITYVPPVMNPTPIPVNPQVPTINNTVNIKENSSDTNQDIPERVIPMISSPIVRENKTDLTNNTPNVGSNNPTYDVNDFFKVQN